ncbi:hypothetical protein [Streptomyces sp.]|nr:hypothetical protein [Streptomyces sp.]HET6355996.1 hypothetical protein [Streptomyces sp.]
MRAICAGLAFLFAFLVVDSHLGREVTMRPHTTHETTIRPDLGSSR